MTIFFDVDGVLNKESDWKIPYSLDLSCVKVLADLVYFLSIKYEPVELVIISTWRAGISEKDNNSPQYNSLVKKLKMFNLKISGSTPVSNKGRQAEVEYYIHRNNIKNYVIIDDDKSLFEEPEKLIIYEPNYRTGLKKADLKKIIKLIKKSDRIK